jgi:hypothetical protein
VDLVSRMGRASAVYLIDDRSGQEISAHPRVADWPCNRRVAGPRDASCSSPLTSFLHLTQTYYELTLAFGACRRSHLTISCLGVIVYALVRESL